jgi:hypothetical protein
MHFPITQSSMAFLKIKVMLLSLALDQLKKLEWRHCGGERKIAREILNPLLWEVTGHCAEGRVSFSEEVGVGR